MPKLDPAPRLVSRGGTTYTRNTLFQSREEAKIWIIRNQFGRRNLSAYQRSELALKLEPLIREKARENLKTHTVDGYKQPLQNSANPADTRAELARIAGVSHDTIAKVKKINEQASEELKKEVRTGEKYYYCFSKFTIDRK